MQSWKLMVLCFFTAVIQQRAENQPGNSRFDRRSITGIFALSAYDIFVTDCAETSSEGTSRSRIQKRDKTTVSQLPKLDNSGLLRLSKKADAAFLCLQIQLQIAVMIHPHFRRGWR